MDYIIRVLYMKIEIFINIFYNTLVQTLPRK